MRNTLLISALLATVTLPAVAHATCHQRKVTGTVAGAVGGGLIGGLASHNAGWGFLGAGLGALAGHTIAGATCHDEAYYPAHHYHHAYYHRHGYYRREAYGPADDSGAGGAYAQHCVTSAQNYYDERGNLVQRPTRVCS